MHKIQVSGRFETTGKLKRGKQKQGSDTRRCFTFYALTRLDKKSGLRSCWDTILRTTDFFIEKEHYALLYALTYATQTVSERREIQNNENGTGEIYTKMA